MSDLFGQWPAAGGRIARVLYSPPDWDDHPRSVPVAGRRVKTGCFPRDDTRRLVLTMLNGSRVNIDVIAPDTAADRAALLLGQYGDDPKPGPADDGERADPDPTATQSVWENEGGHP